MHKALNERGYKKQIFQYRDKVKFVQSFVINEEGLQEFAKYLRETHDVDIKEVKTKLKNWKNTHWIQLGEFRYCVTTQFNNSRFYYKPIEPSVEIFNVDARERSRLPIMEAIRYDEKLKELFTDLKQKRSVVRVSTYDSDRYGKPWGVIGRIDRDRITIEFASPVWPTHREIRYADLNGMISVEGDADVDSEKW